jgi:hypothetical protein
MRAHFVWEIVAGGPLNILAALKDEASKLQRQLDSVNTAIKVLVRRKERRRSRQETTCLCNRKGQDVEGTEGALGEGERR